MENSQNLGNSQIRVDVIDFHVTKYRSSPKMDLRIENLKFSIHTNLTMKILILASILKYSIVFSLFENLTVLHATQSLII
jgi:hypothetical protein